MRVMIFIKSDKASEAGEMPSEQMLFEMGVYNENLVKAGIMLTGEGLHPSSKGARVYFTENKHKVIKGPFSEAKELIAGFWLWQVESLEEAIEWVKLCPISAEQEAEIEIRQVFDLEDFSIAVAPKIAD